MSTKAATLLLEQTWIDSIDSEGGIYCIDRSLPMIVHLSTPYDSILPPVILCTGDSILFDNQVITETGIYTTTLGDCDTLISIQVISSSLTIPILSDTFYLDCVSSSVIIDGTSTADTTISYRWLNDQSLIVSDSSTFVATSTGTFTLMVDDGICNDSKTFLIRNTLDTISFSVLASTTDLNCRDTFSLLSFNSNYNFDSIVWERTGERISNSDSIIIIEGGTYRVTLYGVDGCILTDEVVISQDNRESTVSVVGDTLSCLNTISRISWLTVQGQPAISIAWTDPDGQEYC